VSDQLKALLREVLEDTFAGRQASMAAAVGLTQSHLSRALRDGKNFGVENCLRLALETGRSAGDILRAAGKLEVADLLEQLYGPPRKAQSPLAAKAMARIEQLDAEHQKLAVDWLSITLRAASPPTARGTRKRVG
jgi:transcriptional regulator with XRE-family HTH domain